MMTGMPAITKMTSIVGASNIQANRPWPSLNAFFLRLWPSLPAATELLLTAVAVAIAHYLLRKGGIQRPVLAALDPGKARL